MSAPANAYLVTGDDPGLVVGALGDLLRRLAGEPGEAGQPVVVEEYGPASSTSRGAAGDWGDDGGGDAGGSGSRPRIDLGPVLGACMTPPFLADRRVVVLRHAGLLDAAQSKLVVAYLAEPLPTTVLVLVADEKSVGAALERAVRGKGEVVDVSVGTGKARSSWLDDHLRHAPVKIGGAARALLDEHLGEDLARLPGLLSMLATAYGEGAAVGPEELEPFLGEAGAGKPWDLTDAIDAGDGRLAVEALHRSIGAGERHELVVLASLHRHFGAMLRLDGSGVTSDAEAAEMLRTKPFPAGKALRQARRIGHDQVVRAIGLLAEADLDLRGRSGIPPEVVLEILVARLAQLARTAGARPAAGGGGAGRRRAPA